MSSKLSDFDNDSTAESASVANRPKKCTTTFLLTTYKMLEDANNAKVIRWQNDGNSFVITNIEEFVKILPRYFKTKNYSSFVRQLNLYNFHKIKNQEGLIEFGHEQFRKGAVQNLQYITRKINHDNDLSRQKMRGQKPMAFEYNRLLGIIRNLENSLRNANTKTEAMTVENERLVRQLESTQRKFERNTRILLYVIFLLTTNYTPEINRQLQLIFENYGTSVDPALFQMNDVQSLRKILDESRILNTGQADFMLEELLKFAITVHNGRQENLNNKIEFDNVLTNLDSRFRNGQNLHHAPLMRGNSSCARVDFFNKSPAGSVWTPSIADPYEEENENEYGETYMSLEMNGKMEIESDSLATVEQSNIGREEPEMIFPETKFRCHNHGPKAERVSS